MLQKNVKKLMFVKFIFFFLVITKDIDTFEALK